MEDRKLDAEEKLKLIQTIINSEGLYAVNEYLQSIMPKENKEVTNESVIKEPSYDTTIKTTIKEEYTTPKEASIYRMDAIKLVEQDKIDHPDVDIENTSSMEKEITKGPVKKLVNNPWASAEGIKTVSPGELNLN
mgnify:CR=1 FL=1